MHNNPFGMNELIDNLKSFCQGHDIDAPMAWIIKPDGYYMSYAVSIHLSGKDRWEEFDTNVIFILRDLSNYENREVEKRLLKYMFEEVKEPIVLTLKSINDLLQQKFLREVGLIHIPVRWSDSIQNEYSVYVKGELEMGGFVNLMERIEYIGKEIIYKYYYNEGNG